MAEKLRANPALIDVALRRLEWYRGKNPASARYYDEWQRLISGPLDLLIATLVSESEAACALRQESPFVDLILQVERARIYRTVVQSIDQANVQ